MKTDATMDKGRFDNDQERILRIEDAICDYLYGRVVDDEDRYHYAKLHANGLMGDEEWEYVLANGRTMANRNGYGSRTRGILRVGMLRLRMAYIYADNIDKLLSGDLDEEGFLKAVEKDYGNVMQNHYEIMNKNKEKL